MDENFDRKSVSNKSRYLPKAFTERGLYMLATILKSPRATRTTLAIIDTFVEIREMARTIETLQNVSDGGEQQQTLLKKTGDIQSLQFLQGVGGTENPHYLCAAKQKKHHETDTIILQTARRFRQLLLDAPADGVF